MMEKNIEHHPALLDTRLKLFRLIHLKIRVVKRFRTLTLSYSCEDPVNNDNDEDWCNPKTSSLRMSTNVQRVKRSNWLNTIQCALNYVQGIKFIYNSITACT